MRRWREREKFLTQFSLCRCNLRLYNKREQTLKRRQVTFVVLLKMMSGDVNFFFLLSLSSPPLPPACLPPPLPEVGTMLVYTTTDSWRRTKLKGIMFVVSEKRGHEMHRSKENCFLIAPHPHENLL